VDDGILPYIQALNTYKTNRGPTATSNLVLLQQ